MRRIDEMVRTKNVEIKREIKGQRERDEMETENYRGIWGNDNIICCAIIDLNRRRQNWITDIQIDTKWKKFRRFWDRLTVQNRRHYQPSVLRLHHTQVTSVSERDASICNRWVGAHADILQIVVVISIGAIGTKLSEFVESIKMWYIRWANQCKYFLQTISTVLANRRCRWLWRFRIS